MVQYGYGLLPRLPDNHLSGIVQNCKRALEGRSEEEAFFSFFFGSVAMDAGEWGGVLEDSRCARKLQFTVLCGGRRGCWEWGFSKTADAPQEPPVQCAVNRGGGLTG